jgi:hypothetical protein
MERVSIIFLWLTLFFVPTKNSYGRFECADFAAGTINFSVFEENGKVGLKDEKGKVLIPATFEALGWSNGKLFSIDNVVGFKSNGLWGLISLSNKRITTEEFLELIPGEGFFLIAKKKSPLSQRWTYGCINTAGKVIIPFAYDGLRISNMRVVVTIRTQNKFNYGLLDFSNKLLIPIQYQRIHSLGSLRYAVENFENKTAIFSEDGKQVTNFLIDSISSFKTDYAIVYQNQRQGLINRNGELKLEPTYREIALEDDGSIRVRSVDSWIFLKGDNKQVNAHQADLVKCLSPDHYAIQVSGKIQLTNNSLKPLHDSYFTALGPFQKGKAVYRVFNKKGLIDNQGKILLPAKYNELIVDDDFLLAKVDVGNGKNRWVLLDSVGNALTEKHYEAIAPFNGKFFRVRNRGYWGALDAAGKEIVACVHDSILQQADNHIVVKFKGEYGIINMDENWIITPQKNPLQLVDEERYFEFAGKTTFLKSLSGNIIYFSDNRLEFKGEYLLEYLASGAYWTINLSGIITNRSYQPENTEKIFQESEGLRAIQKDGKYGFIDERGRLRIANRYEDVQKFSNGLAAVKIRGKWGFVDEHEALAIQPVYDHVSPFQNGYAVVRQSNLSGVIDRSGKIVLPLRYGEVVMNQDNRYILKQGNLFGLSNRDGTVVINPKYDEITDLGNGYVIVQRNGKYGLLTLYGLSTIPMIYDGLTFDPYHDQYLAIKKAPWEVVKI